LPLPSPQPEVAQPKVNILLVDDQPANLLALEAILGNLNQNLVKATSGSKALHYLADDDFAVVLLDVQMKDLNGFQTARLLRSRQRSRHTPIIFITAYDTTDFPVVEAYKLGAVDYLIKPLVPEVLRAKVAGFVELCRKSEQLKRQAERLQASEDELVRSNRDLEQFAYAASHDLKEPLRKIRIYLELLAERCLEKDPEIAKLITPAVAADAEGHRRFAGLCPDWTRWQRYPAC
jgi:CheY-like chemotaxis protein